MKINKRYTRNIKENLSFYLSSLVLTMVALLAFFLMNIAGNGILDFADDFFAEHQLEDANFSVYVDIPEEDISEIEETFNLQMEAQKYINIEQDQKTVRVFQVTKKINTHEITEGTDIDSDDEVILSEGYAKNQGIQIGDIIKINNQSYSVSGFFQRPDYLYMLENPEDDYKNNETFFLCYMTDEAFEKLGTPTVKYFVKYNDDNSLEFRKYINDNYYMSDYLAVENNMRIRMVKEQAMLFLIMSYMVLVILPMVVVLLISIIIGRKVKNEQRMIGTLSALGYKKSLLIRHYAGFATIPGLLGGVLSVVIAAVCAQPFGEVPLNDYEPLKVTCHLSGIAAVLGILVPTLLYIWAAAHAVNKLLKKDTVLLLAGNADGKEIKNKHILTGSKMSFRRKFAIRSLLGNPGRTFVVFLGVFLGCFMMLFGYSFFDSISNVADVSAEKIGDFQYEYFFNVLKEGDAENGAPVIAATVENEAQKSFALIGVDPDNEFLHFKDKEGNDVNVSDGYYLTSVEAMVLKLEKGDKMKLYNPLTMEFIEIVIDGIIDNDFQKAIFTSRDAASEIMGMESGVYNALMSNEELDFSESELASTVKKADTAEQVQNLAKQMEILLHFLLFTGVIVCMVSIYVTVNTLVTENKGNISMLKVLGYENKKINAIVLNVHNILLPLGILVCIPAVYAMSGLFFYAIADMEGALIPTYISAKSYLVSVALTIVSYFGSLFLVRRKVQNVDMVESLKDNRE